MKSICTTLLFSLLSFVTYAQVPQGLKLDMFENGGSGCQAGSIHYTIAPDGSAVSFLFDNYALELQGKGKASKECKMKFRLTPPKGFQLVVARVDYRGFQALPDKSTAQFWSRIRQSMGRVGRYIGETRENFHGATTEEYFVPAQTNNGKFSNCDGWPLFFEFETTLNLKNQSSEMALISLDSADIDLSSAATMQLAWERCR